MLINNKSLIKTINKLNLTDDEREKFNKFGEDDRGNFLYNGKPVIGGATTEQAAQIEANRVAIGDENSGLIKDVHDLKTKLILSEENKTRLSEAASILEELNR